MTTTPSPAAQAVLDAYASKIADNPLNWLPRHAIAAALRAAADQVITETRLAALDTERSAESRLLLIWARDQWRAIAAELEGGPGSSSTH